MKIIVNCAFVCLVFANSEAIAPTPIKETKTNVKYAPPVIPETDKIVNDLYILHPSFRNKVIMLIYECKKQGIELKVVETYRTHQRQNELKQKKFSKLHGGRSKHQYFLAIDVVPVVRGIPRWYDDKLWKKIGKIGESQGLKWGGRWKKLYDPGHFEYPISIDDINNIPIPDTVLIPLNYENP